jgi:hypothetical protein
LRRLQRKKRQPSSTIAIAIDLDRQHAICDTPASFSGKALRLAMIPFTLPTYRNIWCVVLTAFCLLAAGCANWNPHGGGFGDESARWGEKMRPPTNPGNLIGYDTRAREIERNLGVR